MRKLDIINGQSKKYNVPVTPPVNDEESLNKLLSFKDKKKARQVLFDEVQTDISQMEKLVQEESVKINESEKSLENFKCI